jgi:hypothetical protein
MRIGRMSKWEESYYMDLVNEQVMHKVFGRGKVVKCNNSFIKIDFPVGKKKFVFPDAFETFLTLTDPKSAKFVEKIVQEKKKAYQEEKKRLNTFKPLENEKGRRFLERERLLKIPKTPKPQHCAQSVFWCTSQELDSVFAKGNIFTGEIKSGKEKGQPKRLARISQNSACLLTTRDSDAPEKNRRIIGVFMVTEKFNSKQCVDGYIPAHSEYRLRLSEKEAEKMLFWNYYVDTRYPHKMTWNTGRHRYFDNEWMAQILRDIISIKKKPQEIENAQRFFEYFCRMNQIDKEELPKPNGALM